MRILLLSAAPCAHDARPRFTARLLASLGHDVTLLCRAVVGAPAVEYIGKARLVRVDYDDLTPLGQSRSLDRGRELLTRTFGFLRRRFGARGWPVMARSMALCVEFWSIAAHADALLAADGDDRCNAVHAIGLPALAAAGRLAERQGAILIYDAVELERDRNARYARFFHWLRLKLERYWIVRANGVTTVSEEIALQLSRDYQVPRPWTINNVAPLNVIDADLRQDIGMDPDTPLAVYVGASMNDRGLAPTIRAIGARSAFHLAVVGPSPEAFRARFRSLIAASGAQGRVHVAPVRPPSEAAAYIQGADVAVAVTEPSCASYAFALPNKLFQSVAASLPVVVGRTPALRRVVTAAGVGESVDERDPAALADAIERQAERRSTGEYMAARAAFLARYEANYAAADWARLYARVAATQASAATSVAGVTSIDPPGKTAASSS